MAKKLSKRLVALSSGAVAAIYLLGYLLTQNPRAIQPGSQLQCAAQASHSPTALARSAQRGQYRDGVYCGVGSSPYGDVEILLTIRAGKISRVTIAQISTFFSASVIEGLPAAVVRRQNADIDLITGATGSSQAFQEAIQNALRQASF
jgi:uncharacterized protein with FMN-binding domain